jgi:cyanophycinase
MPRNGSPPKAPGHLVIIGGGEDRKDDKQILSRFVELSGGEKARIAVLTAASRHHNEMMEVYERAFGDLGVRELMPVRIEKRAEADEEDNAAIIEKANGIFMTGGDQRRLVALIGGTAVSRAMHHAFNHGACIAGTSAGASAISEHMLSAGEPVRVPDPMHPLLGAGLGFLRRAAIDQHFSERRRLGRLLSVVAANPYLLGMGIDEDTAVVIEPGSSIEVLGEGAVTIVDGREVVLNAHDVNESNRPQMSNIRLHLLPSGFHHRVQANGDVEPRSLDEIIRFITSTQATVQ